MTTRVWTKKETQRVIKDLRNAGYLILKLNGMYKIYQTDDWGEHEVWKRDGRSVFTAMPGHQGYLVSYHDALMKEV